VSSTEDDYEEEEEEEPPVDDVARLLDEPLTNREFSGVAHGLFWQYNPSTRYNLELEFETDRLSWAARKATENTRKYFVQYGSGNDNRAGHARTNIIARRNIKRRWERLGVWNPAWGIPGREDNPLPKDNEREWKWPWHDETTEWRPFTAEEADAMVRNPRHPAVRALELRRGMRQADHSPVIPRSRLGKDVSASQGESFITSRPWFMLEVEQGEREARVTRLFAHPSPAYSKAARPPSIATRWNERGDWKEEWPENYHARLVGWKWRHESPSPEPEDHNRLDDPTLDLTPSEVDALEAVRPPTPPAPQFLVYVEPTEPPKKSLFGPPLSREEVERRNREIRERPPPPLVRWSRLCQPQQEPVGEDAPPPAQTSEDTDRDEPVEQVTAAPRPTRKRRHQEEPVEEQVAAAPPAPRQGRKRRNREEPAEPVEEEEAPRQKRQRRSRAEPAEPVEEEEAPRQKRQRRTQAEGPPPSDPAVRRSARIAARNAATTVTAATTPATRPRPRPARVSEPKPPAAQPKGRPRKKARR